MDRRSFLALLGLGAAAIATPEPVRSYFFGPWTPPAPVNPFALTHDDYVNAWDAIDTSIPSRLIPGPLVTLTELWTPDAQTIIATFAQYRAWIDERLMSHELVCSRLGLDRIPGTNLYDPTRRDSWLIEAARRDLNA